MAMKSVILVNLVFGLSQMPRNSAQSGNQTQPSDRCDEQCRWTCLLMNTFESVQGDSPETASIATSSTCMKGPPGDRGERGSPGVRGPAGPVGIPGYRGETGGVVALDHDKIENMIAATVRDMLAQTTPMTGCHDVRPGFEVIQNRTGGVFKIYPSFAEDGTKVYCDLKTDDKTWTVFQRRMDGFVSFNRTWDEYVNGFGSPEREFWMGLEKLYLLTRYGNLVLRIDMEDWDGNRRYAEYTSFSVGGKYDKYRLRYRRYSGTAGDALYGAYNNRFSTYDQDNDKSSVSCSRRWGYGGWWFQSCLDANLNGPYSTNSSVSAWQGVVWGYWRGPTYSLKSVEMKFRFAS